MRMYFVCLLSVCGVATACVDDQELSPMVADAGSGGADAALEEPDAETADAGPASPDAGRPEPGGLPVWFEFRDPMSVDEDRDGVWRPGERLDITVTMTNVTDNDFNWYPEAILTANSDLVSLPKNPDTRFAVFAGQSVEMMFAVVAQPDATEDSTVTFTVSAHALDCETSANCPHPSPLSFDVVIGAQ